MIIFMPFDDFTWSARCLDDEDLSNLRVDILKVMEALLQGCTKRGNHPSVLMWQGYEQALLAYQQAVCWEWSSVRGNDDIYWKASRLLFMDVVLNPMATPLVPPPWMGNKDLHISHQSNLLRMNEEHYRRHFPGIKANRPYIWPVK